MIDKAVMVGQMPRPTRQVMQIDASTELQSLTVDIARREGYRSRRHMILMLLQEKWGKKYPELTKLIKDEL